MIEAINLSKYEERNSKETDSKKGWVNYGEDNLYPDYLISLYNSSAVHGALVNSIAHMIFGEGINAEGNAQLLIEKLSLNKEMRKACLDLKLQGGYYLEVHWNIDRTGFNKIEHIPFERIRSGVMNEQGEVNTFFHCLDWENYQRVGVQEVPRFSPSRKNEEPVQLIAVNPFALGSSYYPRPDYKGAINWIEVDKQVGIFHNNNINNGMAPSFAIHWKNGIPDPEKRAEIRRDFTRQLSGAKNSGKFVMTFSDGGDTAPDMQPFDLSDAHNQYEFISKECTDKIMIGHRVTSPALFGVKTAGQLGATEEIKTSMQIFERDVIKPFRELIDETIETILQESGYEAKAEVTSTPLLLSEDLSLSDEEQWLAYLENIGETIDSEEWELLSEEDVTEPNDEYKLHFEQVKLFKRFANPDDKSEIDTGLYKIRYRYSDNISDKSRLFCKNMVANSKNGVVYRFEDIQSMDGVNSDFAPKGKSSYSIWLYKGGCYCHHKWVRQIYFRKRNGGKFMPNDGLKNDKEVSGTPDIPLKDRRKGWNEANTAPIDTPNRGKLN